MLLKDELTLTKVSPRLQAGLSQATILPFGCPCVSGGTEANPPQFPDRRAPDTGQFEMSKGRMA